MGGYMTKQRKELLSFLALHTDETLSAKEIFEGLSDDEISRSAVYRNLSFLEKEGLIKRVSKAGIRDVFYQYTDAPECKNSLHLSCKKCGRTFHMKSSSAKNLINSVKTDEDFAVDKTETVLYGICKKCQEI